MGADTYIRDISILWVLIGYGFFDWWLIFQQYFQGRKLFYMVSHGYINEFIFENKMTVEKEFPFLSLIA